MKSQQYYFHLGLPKTASTFLQVVVFPKLSGIDYYRKRKFKHFEKLAKNSTAKKLLFTTESDRGFEQKLHSITSAFPDAKIILVFRRHDRWIMSKYKYYVRKHGHLRFEDFFDLQNDQGLWKIEELYFYKYIELVRQYSKYEPLVLTFEELKENHQAFIQKTINYLGLANPTTPIKNRIVKKAFSNKQVALLQLFNNWYRYKELRSSSRFLNKVHYKYREFLLHTIAFLAQFIPGNMVKTKKLIDASTLEDIRSYYQEDWNKILSTL